VSVVAATIPDVVLAGEDEVVLVFEVRLDATKSPHNGAVVFGDLVDGVAVAARNDIVAFWGLVD
jgi:hypothetical protein